MGADSEGKLAPRYQARDQILQLIRNNPNFQYRDVLKIIGSFYPRTIAVGETFHYIVNRILDEYVLPCLGKRERQLLWKKMAEYSTQQKNMVKIDEKTGLLRHQYFLMELGKLVTRNPQIIVVMIDLDHFGRCNKDYGHERGDEVLKTVGELLRKYFPEDKQALVGRYGGEEFMMAVPKANFPLKRVLAQLDDFRKEYRAFVTANFSKPGSLFQGTASIGIYQANFLEPEETIERARLRADQAQSFAKRRRNQVIVWPPPPESLTNV